VAGQDCLLELVKAGADVRAVDRLGRNCMHLLLLQARRRRLALSLTPYAPVSLLSYSLSLSRSLSVCLSVFLLFPPLSPCISLPLSPSINPSASYRRAIPYCRLVSAWACIGWVEGEGFQGGGGGG
jgi:hypothetical protein